MMIAIGGLVAAVGFWFLIGLVLHEIVGRWRLRAARRGAASIPPVLWSHLVYGNDRYVLYERLLGPEEDILNRWPTVPPSVEWGSGPHGDPP